MISDVQDIPPEEMAGLKVVAAGLAVVTISLDFLDSK
jgi:hypothetical protein